jgi:hypothetical protein
MESIGRLMATVFGELALLAALRCRRSLRGSRHYDQGEQHFRIPGPQPSRQLQKQAGGTNQN